jgi:hypothetical protein
MRRFGIGAFLVGVGIVVGLSVSSGRADSASTNGDPDAKRIIALLSELRETWRAVAKTRKDWLAAHQELPDPVTQLWVAEAHVNALKAELDLAKSPAERVAIRERILAHYKDAARLIAKKNRDGQAESVTAYEAKAAEVQAELDLLRERLQ